MTVPNIGIVNNELFIRMGSCGGIDWLEFKAVVESVHSAFWLPYAMTMNGKPDYYLQHYVGKKSKFKDWQDFAIICQKLNLKVPAEINEYIKENDNKEEQVDTLVISYNFVNDLIILSIALTGIFCIFWILWRL